MLKKVALVALTTLSVLTLSPQQEVYSKQKELTDDDYCNVFYTAFENAKDYSSHGKVSKCKVDDVIDLSNRWVLVKIKAFWEGTSFIGSSSGWYEYSLEIKKDGSSYKNFN